MTQTSILIVGAGFSGLGMAVYLDLDGRTDWLLLEAADTIGGTWRDNRYPGAACDVPSHLYSFSFALNPHWSHKYAPSNEIRAYLEDVATGFGLRDRIRTGHAVERATWDEARQLWVLVVGDQVFEAPEVIFAVGALNRPKWPSIPGREGFGGVVAHSARWPEGLDLTGMRVGVIGTGASAVQVVPAIAEETAHTTVFQRTPPWIRRREDRPYTHSERWAFARSPWRRWLTRSALYWRNELSYQMFFGRLRMSGLGEWVLTRQIRDALGDNALVEQLRPDYTLGCKRVLVSDDWYPTLARPDVEVETTAIASFTEGGVLLEDGREQPLDAIVCCTGFELDPLVSQVDVYGRDGRALRDVWGPRPVAHLGTTVHGFPNAYVLFGPNTGLGHTSMIVMIESQIRYVLGALRHRTSSGASALEVRRDALEQFVRTLDTRHADTVWHSGCDSWYLGPGGVNYTLWPRSTLRFMLTTARFDAESYIRSSRGSSP